LIKAKLKLYSGGVLLGLQGGSVVCMALNAHPFGQITIAFNLNL